MKGTLQILLVEDNEGDVELTRCALEESEVTCVLSVANDGLEALDFLHKRNGFADASTPQLILLDLNMPRMDGKQFLEAVKAEAQFKAIPVVILTSSQSPTDIRECYERQAGCYIVKPFDGGAFTDAIQQVAHFWGNLGRCPV